jgi:hypothetical protein
LLLRKLGKVLVFTPLRHKQSQTVGVKGVLAASAVLKIVEAVVRSVAIEVVDFVILWAGTNERLRNKLMGVSLKVAALATEKIGDVPISTNIALEQSASVGCLARATSPHPAPVRDFIPGFVAHDWTPFLWMAGHPFTRLLANHNRLQVVFHGGIIP